MKRIYNNFLIISTVALLMGGVYSYFYKDLSSTEIVPVAFGSSLSSSVGAELLPSDPLVEDKISSDISFLTSLVSLKTIKIDTALFTNKAFNNLQDNSVNIGQVQPGRVNPFAKIDINKTVDATSVVRVSTGEPTQITNKTVILNGSINGSTGGVKNSYFEYGPTVNLGTVTGVVDQSLIGTFFKNISGLNTNTTYFFKACSKINNVTLCGDVVSFKTN